MKKQLIVMYKENKENPKNSWSGTSYNLREALKDYYDVIFVDTNDSAYLRFIKKVSRIIGSFSSSKIFKPYYELLHKKQMEKRINQYPNVPVIEIAENVELDNRDFYLYRDMAYSCFNYVKKESQLKNRTFVHGMIKSLSDQELEERIKTEVELESKAKGIFYMGKWLKKEMSKLYPENANKYYAVGGGLNSEFDENNEFIEKKKQILFVGVDFYRKGGDLVVNAFKKMNEKYHTDYNLIIAGVDEQQGYTGKNIQYLGNVSRNELTKIFKESSVFVMPSRFEAYGLVFAEALCFGLPIVALDDYEMTYFVENDKNGILVKDEDISNLAEAIYKVMNDKDMQDECIKKSQKYRELYSWDNVAKKIYEVIG